MVDNRSAGVFGIGGALNFKSGDISGTAAKTSDDKMGQGTEYFATEQMEENQGFNKNPYTDRSAQLSATLNSLALMNVAGVIKRNKRSRVVDEQEEKKEKDKEKSKKDSQDSENTESKED